MENLEISLVKVSTNNLKNIDVKFPLNKLTVVTGVSGSGKSSLVFDTLYAESYRRFVDSLSSYARQYLKTLPKPGLDSASQVPPAIAVKQGRPGANQRSTVGTLTELNHLTQTLFTHLGKIICFQCGKDVERHNTKSIVSHLFNELSLGTSTIIVAPLKKKPGMKTASFKAQLQSQGFSRIYAHKKILDLEDTNLDDFNDFGLFIDQVSCSPQDSHRLSEAIETAMKIAKGSCSIISKEKELYFSANLECSFCRINYIPPSLALFSFNHPLGACDTCQGYGRTAELDWDKIIPDKTSSIAKQGIVALNFGSHTEYYEELKQSAKKLKIDLKKPFTDYTKKEWQWLREGDDKTFGGVLAYFAWLNSKKYKAHYRIHAAKFNRYKLCPSCNGKRYCKNTLAYKLFGKDIAEVHTMAIKDFKFWLETAVPNYESQETPIFANDSLQETFLEIDSRIHYLLKIGLGYLNMDRLTNSLSGGELQRIHMASCIGSALTDTLYCLDEPSSGLHAADSQNLLETIYELRDQGNTIVVVEHDRTIIRGADHLIEIGPGSGHLGGQIVYEDSQKRELLYPERTAKKMTNFLQLENASTHNLKNVSVKIPLHALTVVCGISGSGKTSLIQHTLFPILEEKINAKEGKQINAKIGPKNVLQKITKALLIDQKGLARSSRSNIATYLGIYDEIRKIFAQQDKAKEIKLSTSSFSFNVPGGRCENCKGLGTIEEDLSFLGEVLAKCPQCEGKRFSNDVLSVTYRGKTLLDILAMTAQQAYETFFDHSEIKNVLQPVLELGLSYLTLGQATSSFSGGEAQRLKLLNIFTETKSPSSMLLIFDEPTTGLSDKDVLNLWKHLDFLTQKGHTIIVIEHHLDMIRHADWLVEVGPGAAELGGQIVYQGPPSDLWTSPLSRTAPFLKN